MDVESRVELPVGHLINLSSRNQRQSGQQQYQAYRASYSATEILTTPFSQSIHRPRQPELGDSQSPPDNMFHRSKATKLPVPKTLSERARDQRNENPSPTGIPKPSTTTFSLGGSNGHSGSRDQYWSKLRDKFERESPLLHRASYVRSRESDQNGSPNHGHSLAQRRHSREGQPVGRGGSPQSGIPSPHVNQASSAQIPRHEPLRNPDSQRKWRKNGDSWVSLELNDTTPHISDRTETTIDSSPHSNASISPVSAEESLTDWEDRFVVNMPSAKDPNPPTMTTQEIAEYQKSIERARREGRRTIDPNTRRSPRIGSPAAVHQRSPPREHLMESFKAYDGGATQPPSDTDHPPVQSQQDQQLQQPGPQTLQHYYSPDEIGQARISTIWEESPTKQREQRTVQAADGSFLGCKEINGPGTKNPDEILLFGSGEDTASLHPRPLALNGKKRHKEERRSSGAYPATRKSGDRSLFQEEWVEVSQNSKPVPCSKRSVVTLCQNPGYPEEHEIQRTGSQGSEKENSHPTESASPSIKKMEDTRGDDDVFIITPTITRTMIPMAEKKPTDKKPWTPKPQGLRRGGDIGLSGSGKAMKAVRAKPQVVSSPSGLRPAAGLLQPSSIVPSVGSSRTTPPSSIPTPKEPPSTTNDVKLEEPKESNSTQGTSPGKSPPGKEKKKDVEQRTSSSIRGFIRTSGLARSGGIVRSPTDSLAAILRNGTESLRNRAESLRNSRKGSPVSLPSRDNSDSSRSDKSFKTARDSPRSTPPPTVRPSPKRESPASKLSSVERPPPERKPSFEKSPPRPATEKAALTEKPLALEKASPGKLSRAERLEKFKEEARIRRANKIANEKGVDIAGIAELDGHQVTGRKNKLQSNITDVHDVCEDLHELNAREKDNLSKENLNPVALSMIFEIVVVAITNMHRLAVQVTDSPYAKFIASNILSMVRHCYRVTNQIIHAAAEYQATGVWPKAKDDQAISRFLVELLQAVVYIVILGFSTLIVYRVASYAFFVASWFLWLLRPIAWVFNCATRALMI
ncbi:hypothetical protein F1880_004843 [Penicillium rolfsii]|nr:hypothetical protein F1880_004843 [Penicillium rolfsii]